MIATAYLLPTGRCNLDCEGCYATLQYAGRTSKTGELSLEEYRRVIDELVAIGVRTFDISGGEPLLYPHLVELCQAIRAHDGTKIMLVSNGTRFRNDSLARLAVLVHRLSISFDGPHAALHDEIRGKRGAFARALEALRRARALRFEDLAVNYLVCPKNVEHVGAMMDMCAAERLDRLALLTYRDVSENGVMPTHVPALHALQAAWEQAASGLARAEYPRNLELVVPAFLQPEARAFFARQPPALRARLTLHYPHLGGKTAFRTTLVVKPHGWVTGDTAMANDAHFDLGHVREGVAAVWNTGATAWRRRLAEREAHLRAHAPCRDCSRWRLCRGGCPAAARHQWGDDFHHDRTCDAFRGSEGLPAP
jgi:radical SAM protein with 4Fe4S-binding SPASM domain